FLLPKFPDFMQRIYLSENDIKQMRASGHVIAVHSDTHPVISRIKKEDQELLSQQIIFPKRELEKLLGEEVNIFTYPHGQKEEIFSDPAVLQDAGYKFVFTTFQDNTSFNPLSVGRYQSFVADTIQSLSDNIWTYTI
ncbi:MAG: polysaccharide deacetylase family protein, partial [Candidatus Doudnabacteria bacterium]|nr:polysaccharide deacetylase family protein [Candidatus Doudnabacteria bacterium]